MFLEKISQYEEKSKKLQKMYSENCNLCKGSGLIKSQKGSTICNCEKTAKIEARLLCNGLPRKFLKLSFDDIKEKSPQVKDAEEYCVNINDNIFDNVNLFLISNNKSLIMEIEAAISNDLAFKRNQNKCFFNILIVSVEDIMQTNIATRNNFEMKGKFRNALDNVDILIINYLGDEIDAKPDFVSKFINDLITKRTFDDKINIISSSMSIEDITNRYGVSFLSSIKNNFKILDINDNSNNDFMLGDDSNGYY